MRSCLSAFFIYFFAAVIVFYSDLPYLPWWADGMAVTLMLMIPVLFTFSGRERKAIPVVLFNALLFGFLISAAENTWPEASGRKKRDGIRFFTYSMQYQAISPFIKRKRTEKRQR